MIVQDITIFILHVIDLHLFEYKCYKLRSQYQNKYIFNPLTTVNITIIFISMVLELKIWNQLNIHQTV